MIRKQRFKNAYHKILRAKYLTILSRKLRDTAPTPMHRVVLDIQMSLVMLMDKKNPQKNESKNIICDFMKMIESRLKLKYKFEKMNDRIVKVQKKWRINMKKKGAFKEKIKKLWIQNIFSVYLELIEDKKTSQALIYNQKSDNFRKSSL